MDSSFGLIHELQFSDKGTKGSILEVWLGLTIFNVKLRLKKKLQDSTSAMEAHLLELMDKEGAGIVGGYSRKSLVWLRVFGMIQQHLGRTSLDLSRMSRQPRMQREIQDMLDNGRRFVVDSMVIFDRAKSLPLLVS